MNKKIKKLLIITSIVLTLPIISLNVAGANEKSTPLSLEKAISTGLKNSTGIQSSEIAVEKLENTLNDTVEAVTDLEDYRKFRQDIANVDYYYLDYTQEVTVATAIAQAELGVNLSKSKLESSKRLTELGIEKNYYEVIKAKQNLISAENALNRTNKLNEEIKAKYKAGTVSESDVILSEADVVAAKNTVTLLEYLLESSLIELSNPLGMDVEEGYSFDTDKTFTKFDKSKEQLLIDYALQNDSDLYKATQERIVAEGTVKVSKSSPNAKKENRRDAELDLKSKQLSEASAKDNVVKTVRKSLLSVYMTEVKYSTAENNLKTSTKNYEMITKLYETGSKTYIDVQGAELALRKAETDLNEALFDYRLALSNLNSDTSGGVKNIQ